MLDRALIVSVKTWTSISRTILYITHKKCVPTMKSLCAILKSLVTEITFLLWDNLFKMVQIWTKSLSKFQSYKMCLYTNFNVCQ